MGYIFHYTKHKLTRDFWQLGNYVKLVPSLNTIKQTNTDKV